MLGRKTGHPPNQSNVCHLPQDAISHRINSPKASDISLEVFSGSTSDLKPTRKLARDRRAHKADAKDSNGREGETDTFLSGPTETPQPLCCRSLSQAWSAYKDVFCCIVTCGSCFGYCRTSIAHPYNETGTEDVKSHECNGRLSNSPVNISPTKKNGSQTKKSTVGSSFTYPDVKIMGKPVYAYRNPSSHADTDSCYKEPLQDKSPRSSLEKHTVPSSHRSSEEYYSFHESDLEFELSGSMSSREIDGLIFKKLTELFSVHQIDELAKCTSDTAFLEKTNKISDLINSITQDYHLDEQDAECRLVRGIIRISTRKSRVRPRICLPSPEENVNRGTLPDSGNETMLASVLTSEEGSWEFALPHPESKMYQQGVKGAFLEGNPEVFELVV